MTQHRQMVNYRDFFALIVGAPRQGDTDAPALSVLAVKHNHLRSQIYKSLIWMRAVQIVCFIHLEEEDDDYYDDDDDHHDLVGGCSTLLQRLVCLVNQVLQFLGFQ